MNYDLEPLPGEPVALVNLADSLLLLGDRDRAAALYEKALGLIVERGLDRSWQYLLLRGQILAHLGRTREAVEVIQDGLQLSGETTPRARYDAALVYTLAGEQASALASAKKALELGLPCRWFSLPWFDDLRADSEFQALLRDSVC